MSDEQNDRTTTKQESENEGQGAPEGTTEPGALFDLMGPEKPKKQQKAKADAKTDAKTKPGQDNKGGTGKGQGQNKKEEQRYPEGTEVRYQRHSMTLPREMTAKEVLDWLAEDDFPELAYEKTELRHDKDKDRLVPVRKAEKKGGSGPGSATAAPAILELHTRPPEYTGGSFPPVARLLGCDGVYEIRSTPIGSFVARLEDGPPLIEGFFPAVPPAPASLLSRTVGIFKERPETEALVSVVYDAEAGEHHLVWQGEHADASSVHYTPLPDDERYLTVAEIHSHHSMQPFFSSDDDGSERAARIYGVVGHVGRERPEARFRYSCGRTIGGGTRFRPVRAEQVFTPAQQVWAAIDQPYC